MGYSFEIALEARSLGLIESVLQSAVFRMFPLESLPIKDTVSRPGTVTPCLIGISIVLLTGKSLSS
ncbi:MAG TPA: hypothetical protein VHR42_04280 [Clostridia bacterium]|nr:hypothetical protein [Clostridia bacterium]